jgi:hypothetical protein
MYNVYGYPGPKGDDAYVVAVKMGYTGNRQQWLDSLKGGGVGTVFSTASVTGTNIHGTLNSTGLNLLVPNFLTTAATGGAGGGDWSMSTVTGSGISIVTGASTNTLKYGNFLTTAQSPGAYLTTAAQSIHTHDYQSTGNYLTTAMASNESHYSATSQFSASFINTGQVGAYLTTAAASNHTHSDLYQSTGAYLTTAMASGAGTNFVGLGAYTTASTAGSDIKITVTSAGLNFGIPKWLTTAMASENTSLYQGTGAYLTTAALSQNTSNYAGVSSGSQSTAGSDVVFTHNTAGLNFGIPKYLTTAQPAGAYLTTADLSQNSSLYLPIGNSTQWATGTLSSALMPLSYSSGFQTATLATVLMPLANSTKSVGLNTSSSSTSGVDLKFSFNSSGATFSVPAWITTAAAGGGIAASIGGNSTSVGAGYSNITSGTMLIAGGSNITLSQDGSVISIVGATLTDGWIGFLEPYVQTNTSAWVPGVGSWYFAPFNLGGAMSGGRLNLFVNNTSTAGINRFVTGASIVSSSSGGKNQSYTYQMSAAIYKQGLGASSTELETVWKNTYSYGLTNRLSVSQSGAASSISVSAYNSISYIYDIGSDGATSASQFTSSNFSNGTNTSMASDALDSVGVSIRNMLSNNYKMPIALNTTLTEGNYWLAMMYSTTHATATSGVSFPGASALIMSQLNMVGIARAAMAGYRGWGNTASNASDNAFFGAGVVYTAASASAPDIIRTQDVKTIANGIVPYFNFERRGLTN